jgi:hypothetical protein
MSKHTPGPWEDVGTVVRTLLTPDGGGFIIADCPAGNADRRANSRLIAAAPQLLEVCKELLESSEYWSEHDVSPDIVDRLKVAIYLAEAGE